MHTLLDVKAYPQAHVMEGRFTVSSNQIEFGYQLPSHGNERPTNAHDSSSYDYRSFRVGLADVIWAWVLPACIIVLWLVTLW